MVFSSLVFVFRFLPLVLALYMLSARLKLRFEAENLVLTAASLYFYAWGEPVWVVLLIFSSALDYAVSYMLDKYKNPKTRRVFLFISVCVNLSLLGAFKYGGFITDNLNLLFSANLPRPAFNLPIGISFYTFQTMSYTIDVYKRRIAPQRSFLKFLMYVSLFPQLIAGPIVRYSDISSQVGNRREIGLAAFSGGVTRFLAGLSKKLLIANYAGSLCDTLIGGSLSSVSVSGIWYALFMYAIHIYFDFSGYSDMAIGLGHMFGFTFPENFRYPYLSASVAEFWRRWHISLSSFFRDYVYIPLGGNKSKRIRNMLAVWLLTGLWHGASWNFILWGLYYFAVLSIERVMFKKRSFGWFTSGLSRILGHVWTVLAVLAGWAIFYFDSMPNLLASFKIMFGRAEFFSDFDLTVIAGSRWFAPFAVISLLPWGQWAGNIWLAAKKKGGKNLLCFTAAQVCFCALLLLFCTASLIGSTFNPFIYFRF